MCQRLGEGVKIGYALGTFLPSVLFQSFRMPLPPSAFRLNRALLGTSAAWLLLASCKPQEQAQKPSASAGTAASSARAAKDKGAEPNKNDPKRDMAKAESSKADAKPEPPRPTHFFGATNLTAPVLSEMEWPPKEDSKNKKEGKSQRLGYLRMGGRAAVLPEAHVKPNCPEGWYELVAGGYVCGKYGTTDMNHPRLRTGTHAPFTDRYLPYEYGYNAANGTPLYRVVPSREERSAAEPWLSPKKKKQEAEAQEGESAEKEAPAGEEREAKADDKTPWYMREEKAGQKPQITLDELKGEGPVAKRMVKGFFLAIDRLFISGGARWYRTTGMLIAPADRIVPWKPPTDFHGLYLDGRKWTVSGDPSAEPTALYGGTSAKSESSPKSEGKPEASAGLLEAKADNKGENKDGKEELRVNVAFVNAPKSKKYTVGGKHASTGGDISRHTAVRLTGQITTVGTMNFEETVDGFWLRSIDIAKAKLGTPPAGLKKGEKWVDVSLSQQTLVLMEGDKPVYATLVSTGRRSPIKDKDHPTPTGTWRIREKHVAATMDGDAASDGPYSIEDVPWIMYFQGSYALHGAFWHANFGHVQSHGCVNLAPADAKMIFAWTDPPVPEGWHGSVSSSERPGTWVNVHE
jgi:hypothetical protein